MQRSLPPVLPADARLALVAARRLAATLASELEDMTDAERLVMARALHHNVEVVGRAIEVWGDLDAR